MITKGPLVYTTVSLEVDDDDDQPLLNKLDAHTQSTIDALRRCGISSKPKKKPRMKPIVDHLDDFDDIDFTFKPTQVTEQDTVQIEQKPDAEEESNPSDTAVPKC